MKLVCGSCGRELRAFNKARGVIEVLTCRCITQRMEQLVKAVDVMHQTVTSRRGRR